MAKLQPQIQASLSFGEFSIPDLKWEQISQLFVAITDQMLTQNPNKLDFLGGQNRDSDLNVEVLAGGYWNTLLVEATAWLLFCQMCWRPRAICYFYLLIWSRWVHSFPKPLKAPRSRFKSDHSKIHWRSRRFRCRLTKVVRHFKVQMED